jgi:hypothetical protein
VRSEGRAMARKSLIALVTLGVLASIFAVCLAEDGNVRV